MQPAPSHGRDFSVGSDAKKIHEFESGSLEVISGKLISGDRNGKRKAVTELVVRRDISC
jgi:hypothetical protein